MPPDEQENLSPDDGGNVIESRLGEVLETRDKSLYWLQQTTGIAYTTLFRLRHNQASSVSFDVMNKVCRALECQPGDLFAYADESKPQAASRPARSAPPARKSSGKKRAAGVSAGAVARG